MSRIYFHFIVYIILVFFGDCRLKFSYIEVKKNLKNCSPSGSIRFL